MALHGFLSRLLLFLGVGIKLIDFKLEFGRIWIDDDMHIVLADEISPDNCRLWDIKTNEKLDKDRFRQDLGNVVEYYSEVARRLGISRPTVSLFRLATPVWPANAARTSGRCAWFSIGGSGPGGKSLSARTQPLRSIRLMRCPV